MTVNLEDYVDVAERIRAFYERFPDGRLTCKSWQLQQIGERLFVVYEARAYRTPDDPIPGEGKAWEPFPGPTQFTRDSELMNAETAAWGRAIIAVGIASKKVASREEVQARNGTTTPPAEPARKGPGPGASEAQRRHIQALVAEKRITRQHLAALLEPHEIELSEGWMDRLSKGRGGSASMLIDTLRKLATPPAPDPEPEGYEAPRCQSPGCGHAPGDHLIAKASGLHPQNYGPCLIGACECRGYQPRVVD